MKKVMKPIIYCGFGLLAWALVMISLGGICGVTSGLFGIGFHSGKTLITNIVK
jgi:uncharacterized membrane protein